MIHIKEAKKKKNMYLSMFGFDIGSIPTRDFVNHMKQFIIFHQIASCCVGIIILHLLQKLIFISFYLSLSLSLSLSLNN